MLRADSPLRDRVIFVEGAPRSGATLLGSLLAACRVQRLTPISAGDPAGRQAQGWVAAS